MTAIAQMAITVSQDARGRSIAQYLGGDDAGNPRMSADTQEDARIAAVAEMLLGFVETSPELREAAFFGPDGEQLYATDGEDWTDGARRLWAAADGDGDTGPAKYAHVATGNGEVLAA